MFEPPKLSLLPALGRTGPRLWVRRLSIWKEPGGELIRTVELRPGLNIIWSPDGADNTFGGDAEPQIGHGSGKTLFCRLLRYCLGEQRFADEEQRQRIAAAFPNGIVGAEVMVDGVCWAVVRPIGNRRRHVAIPNGNLDDVAAGDGPTTSIDPLIESIEQSIISPSVAMLFRTQPGQKAWPIALAWLTRDQECRFDNVLDWRSPSSGSDAPIPASGREAGPRRDALRAFLMAITEDEQEVRKAEERLNVEVEAAKRELSHLDWDLKRRRDRLIVELGLAGQTLPEMPFLADVMRQEADSRLADAAKLPSGDKAELMTAREALQKAQAEFHRLDEERIQIEAKLPAERKVLSLLEDELPRLKNRAEVAASPICPICEVPIDLALATGCKLSHKLHDEQACRDRLEQSRNAVEEQLGRISALEDRGKTLLPDLAVARQSLQRAEARIGTIEKARDERASAWQSATRLKESVQRLVEVVADRDVAVKKLRALEDDITGVRGRLGAFRDRQGVVFGRITDKFDPIVRRLIKQDAKGAVALTGNGIEITVNIGGDRRTAAIDSLKVIAFDLACLCASIQGQTRVPEILVHDSPREADLGLSIYNELFRLVRDLEEMTETPLFQYIVTTTTQPPDDLRHDPWLRLTLYGAPGSARLMGQDL